MPSHYVSKPSSLSPCFKPPHSPSASLSFFAPLLFAPLPFSNRLKAPTKALKALIFQLGMLGAVALCANAAHSEEPRPFTLQPAEEPSTLNEEDANDFFSGRTFRRPPNHCKWEVRFTHSGTASEFAPPHDAKDRPACVRITRHGKEYLQEAQMEDGTVWQHWRLAHSELHSRADSTEVWLSPEKAHGQGRSQGEDVESLSKTGARPRIKMRAPLRGQGEWTSLPELHWIRPEHLRGTFEVEGKPVLVFLHPLPGMGDLERNRLRAAPKSPLAGLPLVDGILAVALHPETRLPVMLQNGRELRSYTFTPLPVQSLELPPKVKDFLGQLAGNTRARARPLP